MNMKRWIGCILVWTLLVGGTFADNEWSVIGKGKGDPSTTSIPVNQQVSRVAVVCREGSVTVKRFVVVRAGIETPYQANVTLKKGEAQKLTIGDRLEVTRFEILAEGQGTYEVRIRP